MAKDERKRLGPGKKKAKKLGTPVYGLRYTDGNGIELYWAPSLGRYVTVPDDELKTFVAPRVIGIETTYVGNERRYGGHGARVKITGVLLRVHLHPDIADECDPEAGYLFVTDDVRLHQLGGVRPGDGVEVHYWMERENQWGIVAHEIENVADLAAFNTVKRAKTGKGN